MFDGLSEFRINFLALFIDIFQLCADSLAVFFEPDLRFVKLNEYGEVTLFMDAVLFLQEFDFVEQRLVFFIFLHDIELLIVFDDMGQIFLDIAFALSLFHFKTLVRILAFFQLCAQAFLVNVEFVLLLRDFRFTPHACTNLHVQLLEIQ
ncbi:MAG: hypothetical protein IIB38_09880 [Candidatus Hydrogenedentes bacterium]|nr:hypothetical protein [Candidatus Hydrogenedentota bacterium]